MKRSILLLCVLLCIILTGCSTNLTANLAPGASFNELGKTYVVRFEPDERQLHQKIADQLSLLGYPASAGEERNIPADVDTLVTYQDNWQWDMSNYMIRIQIQFRDGKTRELIVSGESYRTSLARRSPEEMMKKKQG